MVCGNFTSSFTPKDVLPLVKYIDSDPKLANLTGMIVARDSRNLILVPRIKGHVVNFGDTTRMKEKSHNLFLFYRKVMPHKGWLEYDTVSVKFRDQIVATRRDKKKHNPDRPTNRPVIRLGATAGLRSSRLNIRDRCRLAAATSPATSHRSIFLRSGRKR